MSKGNDKKTKAKKGKPQAAASSYKTRARQDYNEPNAVHEENRRKVT